MKACYEIRKNTTDDGRTSLEPNHTHFILVDNGTSGKYTTEIELRAKLEADICKMDSTGMKIFFKLGSLINSELAINY